MVASRHELRAFEKSPLTLRHGVHSAFAVPNHNRLSNAKALQATEASSVGFVNRLHHARYQLQTVPLCHAFRCL
jgi:hypothetical protein